MWVSRTAVTLGLLQELLNICVEPTCKYLTLEDRDLLVGKMSLDYILQCVAACLNTIKSMDGISC